MFKKILIANRGEIACRILRSCKKLGIQTAAVYSEADAAAMHVRSADEAYLIGPPPPSESYLCRDKIIEAALKAKAEAIHPGYGFLSEKADFAAACQRAGLVFIGPPPSAIEAMGDKANAKRIMSAAGVPVVPGYHGDEQSGDFLLSEANKIGYPVLIKASAGGGGKGMKLVWSAAEFLTALESAQREALKAFGDQRVILERYITEPRHIEVQVFADQHGQAVHLFERDCSVQRRHQKVLEEAPGFGIPDALRQRFGQTAVDAARAIGYTNAGTVEFIAGRDGSFYFMEMNTRLQVEHPVTEMITGIDLVAWQLKVAAGERLPLSQPEIRHRGHAIEVRIYAEEPNRDFLPATGRLSYLSWPETYSQVRVDTGVESGDAISVHYDPMIAKLIVWDEDRSAAIHRLRAALDGVKIAGLATNLSFLAALARHPAYFQGDVATDFIARHRADLVPGLQAASEDAVVAAALLILRDRRQVAMARAAASGERYSPWSRFEGFRLNTAAVERLFLKDGDKTWELPFEARGGGSYAFELAGRKLEASIQDLGEANFLLDLDGRKRRVVMAAHGEEILVLFNREVARLVDADPIHGFEQGGAEAGGSLAAPMPGRIVHMALKAPGPVQRGQPLLILEAMKMEHTVLAPADGEVEAIFYQVGDLVPEGAALVAFKPADKSP